jgi:hypothetical protein
MAARRSSGAIVLVLVLVLVLDFYFEDEDEDENEEEKSVAELGDFLLQGELKFLHVGLRRFVARFFRHDAKPSGLIQIPVGGLAVAERDLAADNRARLGDLIHTY